MKRLALRKSQQGATMLEFAIVGPIFLLLVIVAIDLIRLTYYTVTLEFVAARVLRTVTLGPAAYPYDKSPYTNSNTAIPYDRQSGQNDWLRKELIDYARSLRVPLQASDITICSFTEVATNTCNGATVNAAGNAKQLFAVRIEVPSRVWFWGNKNTMVIFPFQVAPIIAVGMNETW